MWSTVTAAAAAQGRRRAVVVAVVVAVVSVFGCTDRVRADATPWVGYSYVGQQVLWGPEGAAGAPVSHTAAVVEVLPWWHESGYNLTRPSGARLIDAPSALSSVPCEAGVGSSGCRVALQLAMGSYPMLWLFDVQRVETTIPAAAAADAPASGSAFAGGSGWGTVRMIVGTIVLGARYDVQADGSLALMLGANATHIPTDTVTPCAGCQLFNVSRQAFPVLSAAQPELPEGTEFQSTGYSPYVVFASAVPPPGDFAGSSGSVTAWTGVVERAPGAPGTVAPDVPTLIMTQLLPSGHFAITSPDESPWGLATSVFEHRGKLLFDRDGRSVTLWLEGRRAIALGEFVADASAGTLTLVFGPAASSQGLPRRARITDFAANGGAGPLRDAGCLGGVGEDQTTCTRLTLSSGAALARGRTAVEGQFDATHVDTQLSSALWLETDEAQGRYGSAVAFLRPRTDVGPTARPPFAGAALKSTLASSITDTTAIGGYASAMAGIADHGLYALGPGNTMVSMWDQWALDRDERGREPGYPGIGYGNVPFRARPIPGDVQLSTYRFERGHDGRAASRLRIATVADRRPTVAAVAAAHAAALGAAGGQPAAPLVPLGPMPDLATCTTPAEGPNPSGGSRLPGACTVKVYEQQDATLDPRLGALRADGTGTYTVWRGLSNRRHVVEDLWFRQPSERGGAGMVSNWPSDGPGFVIASAATQRSAGHLTIIDSARRAPNPLQLAAYWFDDAGRLHLAYQFGRYSQGARPRPGQTARECGIDTCLTFVLCSEGRPEDCDVPLQVSAAPSSTATAAPAAAASAAALLLLLLSANPWA